MYLSNEFKNKSEALAKQSKDTSVRKLSSWYFQLSCFISDLETELQGKRITEDQFFRQINKYLNGDAMFYDELNRQVIGDLKSMGMPAEASDYRLIPESIQAVKEFIAEEASV